MKTEIIWLGFYGERPQSLFVKIFIYWLAYYALFLVPLLFFLSPAVAIYGFFILALTNTFLHTRVQRKIQTELNTITYLGRMLQSATRLGALQMPELEPYLNTLRTTAVKTKSLRRKLFLTVLLGHNPEMMFALNVLLLLDVRTYFSALRLVERDRSLLKEAFVAIGTLDAMQAVVSCREDLPHWCEPLWHEQTTCKATGLYHPLLCDPVPNDLSLVPPGIVITGSNMSGKSTFLKTAGVSIVMSQTILTVAAESYESCCFNLTSAIGRMDNLIEGKSYYLDEALAVLRIVQTAAETAIPCVFIMDEIFRGTNSEERVAAAVALLRFLAGKNCCTLVATHDMTIPKLTAELYRNCHFQEQIGSAGLVFDYKLLEGPSERTNAIAVLKYVGFPPEITDEAYRLISNTR